MMDSKIPAELMDFFLKQNLYWCWTLFSLEAHILIIHIFIRWLADNPSVNFTLGNFLG